MAAALMIQGTGSDVGKSLMVAGLARAFTNQGLKVRPFKPQNMSNNAAVTADGGEIGRAQHLQALACRATPTVDMNPVLLKPQSETGAQVIVLGQLRTTADARAYQHLKGTLMPEILAAYRRLAADADLILIEGAGSPAEINLPGDDIANMGFAAAAEVPVVLIADIDRGGVIANLVGTHAVLPTPDQQRIAGYIINKFRGDPSLFDAGLVEINQRTEWRDFGIVPYFPAAARLPAEDAMALDQMAAIGSAGNAGGNGGTIRITVPRLSRIANFDDLDPLRLEADVQITIVPPGEALPGNADLIILPGSKSTLADLADLKTNGWDIDILGHVRRGGRVLGICGGYQMLGKMIHDPKGVEGRAGSAEGLGLLDIETELKPVKALGEVSGRHLQSGHDIRGYHIHMGHCAGPDTARPMMQLNASGEVSDDGARSPNGRVEGTYVHGLFRDDGFRAAYLARLADRADGSLNYDDMIEQTLDDLAEHLAGCLDMAGLLDCAHG